MFGGCTCARALTGVILLTSGSCSIYAAHALATQAHLAISLASKQDRMMGMEKSGISTWACEILRAQHNQFFRITSLTKQKPHILVKVFYSSLAQPLCNGFR